MDFLRKILLSFGINAAAVALTLSLLPGIAYTGGLQGIVTITLLLAGVNILIRPVLSLLALPVEIATVAILTLCINGGLLVVLDKTMVGFKLYSFPFPGLLRGPFFIEPFTIPAFGTAFLGALCIAALVSILSWITGIGKRKSHH